MSWTFENGTGRLLDPDGTFVEQGYAGGAKGTHKEGINNPALQFVRDIGPLPVGVYTMGDPVEHSQLGILAIPLTPDPSNDMRGRGGFYCHGDKIGSPGCASDGCIIVGHSTRVMLSESSDRRIQVV
jgi:hypothetical protein